MAFSGILHRPLLIVVAVAVLAVSARAIVVVDQEFSAVHLHRFERIYDIDLPDAYERVPFFLTWTRGDGQAFMALAADLDLDGPAHELAVPSYRFARVGYAWLARLAALGRVGLLPVGLFVVNLVSISMLAVVATRLARTLGNRAFLILANPGLFVGVSTDTAEPLGALLTVLALTSGSTGGVVATALAAATRPTFLAVLPARRQGLLRPLMAAVTVIVSLQIISLLALGSFGERPPQTLVLPFTGYIEVWPTVRPAAAFGIGLLLISASLTMAAGVRRTGGRRLALILSGLLVVMFGPAVLHNPFNYLRAAALLPIIWAVPGQAARVSATVSRPATATAARSPA
jgi:hypothetical protein